MENDSTVANSVLSPIDDSSPDKAMLKMKCKSLESTISGQAKELHASKSAILQLLESVKGNSSAEDTPASTQQMPAFLRKSTDSAALLASIKGRHGSGSSHEYAQQLNSRDRIIADLRARNQALREETQDVAAECRRLQGLTKSDRRLREQHQQMLQSIRSLKQALEREQGSRIQVEQEMESLRAKVKHEASKNAMHREGQRVMENALASKQAVLDDAHATLAALHERFTDATQVLSSASVSALELDAAAAVKAADAQQANELLEAADSEVQRLTVRCSLLIAQLAHERDCKKVSEKTIKGLEQQLQALQTAKGVGDLAARASQADFWQHRANAAVDQLERLKSAYQRVRQQHGELKQRLAEATAATPGTDSAPSPAAPITPPPLDAVSNAALSPSSPPLTPALGDKARAEALGAEVASIRARIVALRNSCEDNPAAAALVI